jgi:glycosyltransferase involved in cell wall biosynthesis
MGRLTVLSVAYPFAPVSADAVGGAEHVLAAIDAALVRDGHRSLVIAVEGSRVAGELFKIPRVPGAITDMARADVHRAVRASLARVLRSRPVDVVHLHGIDFPAYTPPAGPPVLATLHLPVSWYPREALHPKRAGLFLHAVSRTQDRALRELAAPTVVLPPVPNGVPVAALANPRHARRRFALMLGRICPEKGQHLGLEAARQAGIPLLIAGEVFPYREHVRYFRREVVPRLDRQRRFIGPVGFARKRRLLSAARCVLIPSLAPETSSLVAMEAAACGTPVIAFRSGALPETVRDGVTGFVVDDVAAMARALGRVEEIAPETCRQIARDEFDVDRMTAAYVGRYRQLAGLAAAA